MGRLCGIVIAVVFDGAVRGYQGLGYEFLVSLLWIKEGREFLITAMMMEKLALILEIMMKYVMYMMKVYIV